MKVSAIPFVGYPVTDLPRAREFYEGVLGLTQSALWEWEREGREEFWLEYNIGDHHCLALSNAWAPSGSQGGPSTALEVDDIDQAMEQMKSLGALDSEMMSSEVCRFFLAHDPDGKPICLHQRNPA